MSQRKLISCGIILLLVSALGIGAAFFYGTRGVYVRITNGTEATLENVNLAYTQGAIRIAVLEPRASYAGYVNPRGESDLTLEWFDSSGIKHSQKIDVYIETNYSGSIEITIEPGNRILVTDKVKSCALDRERKGHTFFLEDDVNHAR